MPVVSTAAPSAMLTRPAKLTSRTVPAEMREPASRKMPPANVKLKMHEQVEWSTHLVLQTTDTFGSSLRVDEEFHAQ